MWEALSVSLAMMGIRVLPALISGSAFAAAF